MSIRVARGRRVSQVGGSARTTALNANWTPDRPASSLGIPNVGRLANPQGDLHPPQQFGFLRCKLGVRENAGSMQFR